MNKMINKILITNLLTIFFIFENILDGFNDKFDKFNNYYFINDRSDWGNLYIEGLDIDFKAAILAQRKLSGGHFDEKAHCVIPRNFSQTDRIWKMTKDDILNLIGPLPEGSSDDVENWENSSKTVEGILEDAEKVSFKFKQDFQDIASQTRTIANFGLNDEFLIKSEESLVRKLNEDAKDLNLCSEEALARIGDVLRGTIIVDDIDKIFFVVFTIQKYAESIGGKVAFKNAWAQDRESGYVGIHAKILFPIQDNGENNEPSYIITEMQIHLENLVDGTKFCPKERAHLIYENARKKNHHSRGLTASSKLIFLIGMEEAKLKHEKKSALRARK